MTTYRIRNMLTRMVLCEVTTDDPERIMELACEATGSTLEDIAMSLGKTMEEVRAALEIVEIEDAQYRRGSATRRVAKNTLPPRQLYTTGAR